MTGIRPDALIRHCTREDLEQIVRLERECFRFPYDRETFLRFFSSGRSIFLVCEVQREVAGYVICDIRINGVAVVASTAVSPRHRHQGIGSRLLETALERVRGRASRAELQVAKSNGNAIDFYKAHGFTVRGVLPGYYQDGEDAYLMEKPL